MACFRTVVREWENRLSNTGTSLACESRRSDEKMVALENVRNTSSARNSASSGASPVPSTDTMAGNTVSEIVSHRTTSFRPSPPFFPSFPSPPFPAADDDDAEEA